jgi:hypothetical protein
MGPGYLEATPTLMRNEDTLKTPGENPFEGDQAFLPGEDSDRVC